MRLAEIVAGRVERTAQRANRAGISGTRCHVLGLERMLANTALDCFDILPAALRLARDVIFAAGRECDQRRGDESNDQCDERRQRLRRRSEQAIERTDGDDGGGRHRADADRIDVVEVRALELHVWRGETKWGVYHE